MSSALSSLYWVRCFDKLKGACVAPKRFPKGNKRDGPRLATLVCFRLPLAAIDSAGGDFFVPYLPL
jgi:hypothetical protein